MHRYFRIKWYLDRDQGTKSKPIPGPHQVYGFLTTTPNAVVEPIHPKAMPVILTREEARGLDARVLGRGEGIAAAVAGGIAANRSARSRQHC